MNKIDIKPLSVNDAYRGRRFATRELSKFKQDLAILLPRDLSVPDECLAVEYEFGVSSRASDCDNLIKAFQDAIAEFYDFNDKMICKITAIKRLVSKGQEYVKFKIESYDEQT